MGAHGYFAPEYALAGQLTIKSDIYSFGVVFLELITGRRALDSNRPPEEQDLVAWARPLFKDQSKFPRMAYPLLQGRFPKRDLYQALAIAALCLQEKAKNRPPIREVAAALTYLASQAYDRHNTAARRNLAGPSIPKVLGDQINQDTTLPSQHGAQASTPDRTNHFVPEVKDLAGVARIAQDGAELPQTVSTEIARLQIPTYVPRLGDATRRPAKRGN